MVLAAAKPYGLKDLKVRSWSSGSLGAAVDLPAAALLKFSTKRDSAKAEGDDRTVAVASNVKEVEFELKSSILPLDALAVMTGVTVTDSGTTPNQVKRYAPKVGAMAPYFLIEGKALSESGGDFHGKVYKCKVTDDPDVGLENGKFADVSLKGTGIGVTADEASTIGGSAAADECFELLQNETEADIS